MKRLAKRLFSVIIVFFLFHSAFSQEKNVGSNNFSYDQVGRKVSWIKVYEPTLSFDIETLKRYFTENNVLEIKEGDSSILRGMLIPKPIDIQKYGYKRGNTPMFLLDVDQKFNILVEVKDGKYRVTLSEMGYIDNGVISDLVQQSLVGNTSTTAKGNFVSYDGEFSFTNKNEIRTRNHMGFEILDKFYSDILLLKESKKPDDNW
jgi:hypothetical protein